MADSECGPKESERVESLWTVDEVAKYLHVSVRKVWRMLSMRIMPSPVQVGGRSKRWNPVAIREWVARGCPGPSDVGMGV